VQDEDYDDDGSLPEGDIGNLIRDIRERASEHSQSSPSSSSGDSVCPTTPVSTCSSRETMLPSVCPTTPVSTCSSRETALPSLQTPKRRVLGKRVAPHDQIPAETERSKKKKSEFESENFQKLQKDLLIRRRIFACHLEMI
jgi:hypothetical protein